MIIDTEYLKKTVGKYWLNKKDPIWIEAFRQYNEMNEKKLGLKCAPCFYKVLNFHLQKQSVAL